LYIYLCTVLLDRSRSINYDGSLLVRSVIPVWSTYLLHLLYPLFPSPALSRLSSFKIAVAGAAHHPLDSGLRRVHGSLIPPRRLQFPPPRILQLANEPWLAQPPRPLQLVPPRILEHAPPPL
jgi:hypothetical protein